MKQLSLVWEYIQHNIPLSPEDLQLLVAIAMDFVFGQTSSDEEGVVVYLVVEAYSSAQRTIPRCLTTDCEPEGVGLS